MPACRVSWGSEMLLARVLAAAEEVLAPQSRGGVSAPERGGSPPALWQGGCTCLCCRLGPCLDQLAVAKIKEKTELNPLWQGVSLDP